MSECPKIVLFSGGRTSGYLVKLLRDKFPDYNSRFITCFANTGKEMPQTLNFVHEVETQWDIPVIWLEYARVPAASIPAGIFPTPKRNSNLATASERGETTHWFKKVSYETASRSGQPFDELLNWMTVLPNVVGRVCSVQLKVRTVMRFLFSLGYKQYAPLIGIRKDEELRKFSILESCDSFEHPEFPLCDLGITVKDVGGFWSANSFDLQLQPYEGNCDFCFLKSKAKRIRLIREHPERAAWWKNWETKASSKGTGDGKYFRKGEPYELLEHLAKNPHPELFPQDEADIPCSCAEKAFGATDL